MKKSIVSRVAFVVILASIAIIVNLVCKKPESSISSAIVVINDDSVLEPLKILDDGKTATIVTNDLPPINSLLVIRDKGGSFNIPTLAKTSQPPVAPVNPYLKR